jgi:hypothetical protein
MSFWKKLFGRKDPLVEAASEMADLLAKLSPKTAKEADGMSQAEKKSIADTYCQSFFMGAEAIAHKHGLSA